MRGLILNGHDTAKEWGLIMNLKDVTPPEPKTSYVQIMGRDGDIDMTEALSGLVTYNNRTMELIFLLMEGSHDEREELLTEILGTLHGKMVRIVDEDDHPGYYMIGRLTVKAVENNAAFGQIAMTVNCDPYRYRIDERIASVTVTTGGGTKTLKIENHGYKTLCPVITVTGSVSMVYTSFDDGEAVVKSLSAGTYEMSDFMAVPGLTTATITGNGTVTATYREAVF